MIHHERAVTLVTPVIQVHHDNDPPRESRHIAHACALTASNLKVRYKRITTTIHHERAVTLVMPVDLTLT